MIIIIMLYASAYFCPTRGGSKLEVQHTPSLAISHRIAILAHSLHEGLVRQYVQPNRTGSFGLRSQRREASNSYLVS
jgi:hypothetical protein